MTYNDMAVLFAVDLPGVPPLDVQLESMRDWCDSGNVGVVDVYVWDYESYNLLHSAIGRILCDGCRDVLLCYHPAVIEAVGCSIESVVRACYFADIPVRFSDAPQIRPENVMDSIHNEALEKVEGEWSGWMSRLNDLPMTWGPEEGDDSDESDDSPEEESDDDDDLVELIDQWQDITKRMIALLAAEFGADDSEDGGESDD